jgi:class 3 adenylate cyclase
VFTKGDEMVASFATPAAAVKTGSAIRACAQSLGLDVRAAVHAGEVDAYGQEIRGLAMHIGQRICITAQPGQLLVSSTVRDLLAGSNMTFTDAGEHELKGVPGPWRLYAIPA